MVGYIVKFIKIKIKGFQRRIRCIKYGIIYFKSKEFYIPSNLFINWTAKPFIFLNIKDKGFVYEFNEICLNDCYQLKTLKRKLQKVKVIVDIGANQGLFVIAARQIFNNSIIHAYEPNSELVHVLKNNLNSLNAEAFFEAVTLEDCLVDLHSGATDLHSTISRSNVGKIKGTSLKEVVMRAGGEIDILKMDCEGGEWDLFNDKDSWANIRSVTLEYHLWAKSGSSVEQIINTFKEFGFKVISNSKISDQFGLLTCIRK